MFEIGSSDSEMIFRSGLDRPQKSRSLWHEEQDHLVPSLLSRSQKERAGRDRALSRRFLLRPYHIRCPGGVKTHAEDRSARELCSSSIHTPPIAHPVVADRNAYRDVPKDDAPLVRRFTVKRGMFHTQAVSRPVYETPLRDLTLGRTVYIFFQKRQFRL